MSSIGPGNRTSTPQRPAPHAVPPTSHGADATAISAMPDPAPAAMIPPAVRLHNEVTDIVGTMDAWSDGFEGLSDSQTNYPQRCAGLIDGMKEAHPTLQFGTLEHLVMLSEKYLTAPPETVPPAIRTAVQTMFKEQVKPALKQLDLENVQGLGRYAARKQDLLAEIDGLLAASVQADLEYADEQSDANTGQATPDAIALTSDSRVHARGTPTLVNQPSVIVDAICAFLSRPDKVAWAAASKKTHKDLETHVQAWVSARKADLTDMRARRSRLFAALADSDAATTADLFSQMKLLDGSMDKVVLEFCEQGYAPSVGKLLQAFARLDGLVTAMYPCIARHVVPAMETALAECTQGRPVHEALKRIGNPWQELARSGGVMDFAQFVPPQVRSAAREQLFEDLQVPRPDPQMRPADQQQPSGQDEMFE